MRVDYRLLTNLKLLCRAHHLLKTFWTGPNGWRDRQEPDGTIVWTAPTGHTHITKPGGALFFPQLALPTGELALPQPSTPPAGNRGLMMPTRKHTRTQERAYRLQWERGRNEARLAAEAAEEAKRITACNDPPPF
jgi:hypothetical protein